MSKKGTEGIKGEISFFHLDSQDKNRPASPTESDARKFANWDDYMEKLPPRKQIDPHGSLSQGELYYSLIVWQAEQPGYDRVSTKKPWIIDEKSEYEDLIDERVRNTCRAINQLDCAKTTSSCSGHFPISQERIQYDLGLREHPPGQDQIPYVIGEVFRVGPGSFEYTEPHINFLADYNSPNTPKLASVINGVATKLSSQYPNLVIDTEEENIPNQSGNRVRSVSLRLRVSVPQSYIESNHLRSFQELQSSAGPSELDLERAAYKEYGTYFDTPEPKQILQEFFDTLTAEINSAFSKET